MRTVWWFLYVNGKPYLSAGDSDLEKGTKAHCTLQRKSPRTLKSQYAANNSWWIMIACHHPSRAVLSLPGHACLAKNTLRRRELSYIGPIVSQSIKSIMQWVLVYCVAFAALSIPWQTQTWMALWKNLMAFSCSLRCEKQFPAAHHASGAVFATLTTKVARH